MAAKAKSKASVIEMRGDGTPVVSGGVNISKPNFQNAEYVVTGTAPLVMNKFSQKARQAIAEKHKEGSSAKNKKKKEPKDFQKLFEGAQHISMDGWVGIPAAAFRSAMIDACRLTGFVMTRAKLAIFIQADGLDVDDGTPLVKLIADDPEMHESYVRNETGVVDIRVRPMWRSWSAKVAIEWDADILTLGDVTNLLARAGRQCGICEGRPGSKKSHGMGWGTFALEGDRL